MQESEQQQANPGGAAPEDRHVPLHQIRRQPLPRLVPPRPRPLLPPPPLPQRPPRAPHRGSPPRGRGLHRLCPLPNPAGPRLGHPAHDQWPCPPQRMPPRPRHRNHAPRKRQTSPQSSPPRHPRTRNLRRASRGASPESGTRCPVPGSRAFHQPRQGPTQKVRFRDLKNDWDKSLQRTENAVGDMYFKRVGESQEDFKASRATPFEHLAEADREVERARAMAKAQAETCSPTC